LTLPQNIANLTPTKSLIGFMEIFMKPSDFLRFSLISIFLAVNLSAQSVLFDFNNIPRYSTFPVSQTVEGITAHFSGTGQGYSIQDAGVLGFTPAGFSGNIIYPNSVYLADLLINFDQTITVFSIIYACQELACDDAATMRVSVYMKGIYVGTDTKIASHPGTWPVDTLACNFPQGFDSVVVHYDHRPPTCQDYGVIFLADNMTVTPAPPPIIVTNVVKLPNGPFQFSFSATPNASFTVFGATNPTLPFSNWAALSGLTEAPAGHFQFTDWQATNMLRRFYRVSSP